MSFEETKESKFKSSTSTKKKTFYCAVCKITLNSEATRVIHEKGARHMKNVMSSGVEDSDGGIVPMPNPKPRKKIPIKLAQKITDSSGQYIVGLDHITEYIPVSDDGKLWLLKSRPDCLILISVICSAEMEPHYRCGLCDSMGQSNCMFSHLTGRTHRLKFAGLIFGEEAVLDASPVGNYLVFCFSFSSVNFRPNLPR